MITSFSTSDIKQIPFKYAELLCPYDTKVRYNNYSSEPMFGEVKLLNILDICVGIIHIKIVLPYYTGGLVLFQGSKCTYVEGIYYDI